MGDQDNKNLTHENVVNTTPTTSAMFQSNSTNIQKLNGNNFLPWKRQIDIVLKLRGLQNTITDENIDEVRDMQATLLLLETMDDSHKLQVQAEPTAKKIMTSLEQQYASSSENNLHRLLTSYFNFKKDPSDTIFQHVGKLKELRARLASLGEVQSDSLFQANLINTLPSEYRDINLTWNSTPSSLKTNEFLINILQEREELKKKSDSDQTALLLKKTARKLTPKEIEEKKKNTHCGKCGQKGHWWKECTNPPKTENEKIPQRKETLKEDTKPRPNFIGNVGLMGPEMKNKWLADTGATSHMCNRLEWFKELEWFSIKESVSVGDGSTIEVLGKGSVEIITSINKVEGQGLLTEVLFIPELTTNLVSIGALAEKGIKTLFAKDTCTISKDGEDLVVGGRVTNRLYELNIKAVTNSKMFLVNNCARSRKEWHEILGHPCDSRLNDLLGDRELGLEIKSSFKEEECGECPQGKGKRASHPTREVMDEQEIGVVHVDLSGKNKQSLSGYYYFLVCKDEASEFCHVYFLKDKSGTFKPFEELILEYEQDGMHKIRLIRSDNGSEFVNEGVKTLFLKEKIRHETSAPRTPQQNGLIEREMGVLASMARILLLASNVPDRLWPEAVEIACYLRNRLPTAHSKKTPYERFYNRKPYMKHLAKFGTEVHVIVNWQHRYKWSPRTVEGYFIGYTRRVNTFKVYIPSLDRVVVTSDLYWKPHVKNEQKQAGIPLKLNNEVIVPVEPYAQAENEDQSPDNTLTEMPDDIIVSEATETPSAAIEMERRLKVLSDFFQHLEEERKLSQSESVTNDQEPPQDEEHSEPTHQPAISSIINNSAAQASTSHQLSESPKDQDKTQMRLRSWLKKPEKYLNLLVKSEETSNPSSYDEATEGPDNQAWVQAIREELDAHEVNNTWKVVNRPGSGCSLSAKWVFSKKRDQAGDIEKYKARLVARGFEQREGVDYHETFAPVVRVDSIRLLLAIAAAKGLVTLQFDVASAFLNGDLDEEIYLEPPPGVNVSSHCCLKLQKSLYGLKQAPKSWNSKFNQIMRFLKFENLLSDRCVYISSDKRSFVCVYVDDGLIFGENKEICHSIWSDLNNHFKTKKLSSGNFLGMLLEENQDGFFLSQKRYINDIVKKYKLEKANDKTTPLADIKQLFVNNDASLSGNDYRERVGKALYCAMLTRPDVLFATILLSRFSNKAAGRHLTAITRVLTYLKTTSDVGMCFPRSNADKLIIEAYSDADWAGDPSDSRSTSGVVILVSGSPVIFISRKQTMIALSTAEAEYIAASEAAKELEWLTNFLDEVQLTYEQPKLFIDNESAIKQIKNNNISTKSKHIRLKFHHVRALYEKRLFCLESVNTNNQKADFLTKALQGPHLSDLMSSCNIKRKNSYAQNMEQGRMKIRQPVEKKTHRSNHLALMMILVCKVLGFVSGLKLQRTNDIIWTPTDYRVEFGAKEVDLEFAYISVCNNIGAGMDEDNYGVATRKAYSKVRKNCIKKYEQDIYPLLNKLKTCLPGRELPSRKKRSKRFAWLVPVVLTILVLGIIAGVIYSTVYSYKADTKLEALEERQNNLTSTIESVRETFDLDSSINNKTEATLKSLAEKSELNRKIIDELTIITPDISWESTMIHTLQQETKAHLENVIAHCRKNKVPLNSLGKLIDLKELQADEGENNYLTDLTTRVIDNVTIYKLEFLVSKKSLDTSIYSLKAFDVYRDLRNVPYIVRYMGPSLAMYNSTANCTVGVQKDEIQDNYLVKVCERENFYDERLLDWRRLESQSQKPETNLETQTINAGAYKGVYCNYHDLTINNEIIPCPHYPVLIPRNISFKAGNITHDAEHVQLKKTTYIERLPQPTPRAVTIDHDYLEQMDLLREIREKNFKLIEASQKLNPMKREPQDTIWKTDWSWTSWVTMIPYASIILTLASCFCLYMMAPKQSAVTVVQPATAALPAPATTATTTPILTTGCEYPTLILTEIQRMQREIKSFNNRCSNHSMTEE